MDFFGKADPYFKILKSTASGSDWVPVYTSEMYKKTYTPNWKGVELTVGFHFHCHDDRSSASDVVPLVRQRP